MSKRDCSVSGCVGFFALNNDYSGKYDPGRGGNAEKFKRPF